jgi:hypothetical protein
MIMLTGFEIAEKYVPKDELQKVARAALLAQDIKEHSWDAKKEEYKLNDREASIKAVDDLGIDPFWRGIIGDWTAFCWNDVQYWAQEILKQY